MHNDTVKLKTFHEKVQAVLMEAHLLFAEAQEKVKKGEYSSETLVDLGYLFRETANMSDELRKECTARQDLIGMVLAQRITTASLNDPAADPTVEGELASGFPKLRQEGSIPKFGEPGYEAFCRTTGFEEMLKRGLFSLSYLRVSEYLTELAEQGKNPPSGIVKTYNKFSTVFTKKRKGRDE